MSRPLGQILPRDDDRALERMWPMDLALAALSGLVLYTVATRLRIDDPRPLYSAWTYFIGVPVIVVAFSVLLRSVASRFVRRSMQLGFLASVLVHLLLVIAAFNVIIFSQYWPAATPGTQPVRAPIRKTVPDYLFNRSVTPHEQPDWARPVDAATASRVMPQEERRVSPADEAAERLEMAREQPRLQEVDQPPPTPPRRESVAMPSPASSAPPLRRQDLRRSPQVEVSIDVPEVSIAAANEAVAAERSIDEPARSLRSQPAEAELRMSAAERLPTMLPEQSLQSVEPPPIQRRIDSGQPRVGELAAEAEQPSRTRRDVQQAPAGTAPTPPSMRIAREVPSAVDQLSDRATPLGPRQPTTGATLQQSSDAAGAVAAVDPSGAFDAPLSRADRASAGGPQIMAGGESLAVEERRGRGRRLSDLPAAALQGPDLSDLATPAGTPRPGSTSAPGEAAPQDRLGQRDARTAGSGAPATTGADPNMLAAPSPVAALDPRLDVGPSGRPDGVDRRADLAFGDAMPEVATPDLSPPSDRRRQRGGPMTPAGSEVASVRPFERRAMRTSGGGPPTPAGKVGPQTEEAIERGLAYLAERQNPDGSWSLQGHGEEVQIQSDTAATGLCLLAFQGAGYTHKQHQYADTVSRGLEFLLRTQRSDGDLYRPENDASNRNAWFYSHGIAALALGEAYGMTRDPDLREPAQRAINFIVATQNPRSGGWRYLPRASSDTSVTGWMMMALKSGELSGLEVPEATYEGIDDWLAVAQEGPARGARYRYNPYAANTPAQRHGRAVTPSMTAVGLLTRLYAGWTRNHLNMQRGADYLAENPPLIGTPRNPGRDTYYWYYATQVMFHMGGEHWENWNRQLNPLLVSSQLREGPAAGSWNPKLPVPDRWGPHAGRLYVTTMNLLSLEVYYRHLPIYEDTAK